MPLKLDKTILDSSVDNSLDISYNNKVTRNYNERTTFSHKNEKDINYSGAKVYNEVTGSYTSTIAGFSTSAFALVSYLSVSAAALILKVSSSIVSVVLVAFSLESFIGYARAAAFQNRQYIHLHETAFTIYERYNKLREDVVKYEFNSLRSKFFYVKKLNFSGRESIAAQRRKAISDKTLEINENLEKAVDTFKQVGDYINKITNANAVLHRRSHEIQQLSIKYFVHAKASSRKNSIQIIDDSNIGINKQMNKLEEELKDVFPLIIVNEPPEEQARPETPPEEQARPETPPEAPPRQQTPARRVEFIPMSEPLPDVDPLATGGDKSHPEYYTQENIDLRKAASRRRRAELDAMLQSVPTDSRFVKFGCINLKLVPLDETFQRGTLFKYLPYTNDENYYNYKLNVAERAKSHLPQAIKMEKDFNNRNLAYSKWANYQLTNPHFGLGFFNDDSRGLLLRILPKDFKKIRTIRVNGSQVRGTLKDLMSVSFVKNISDDKRKFKKMEGDVLNHDGSVTSPIKPHQVAR